MLLSLQSEYSLAAVLVLVVDICGPGPVSVSDDLVDLVSALSLVQTHIGSKRSEPLAQLSNGLFRATLKAGQVCLALGKHLNQNQ